MRTMTECSSEVSFSPNEMTKRPAGGISTDFSGETATVKLADLQQGIEGIVGFAGREVCCESFASEQWQHLRGGGVFALLSTVWAGVTQHQPGGSARSSALQSTTNCCSVAMFPFYVAGTKSVQLSAYPGAGSPWRAMGKKWRAFQ
jgi:hypothetical protein